MGKDIEQRDETRPSNPKPAPGRPGAPPTWATGAKTAVGTSVTTQSRVWFTVSNGYLNEIYFPDLDRANVRFVRFMVTGDDNFFSDEATDVNHSIESVGEGIPEYRITSHCKHGRYSLVKEILTDPNRDTLLMRVEFRPARDHKRDTQVHFCSTGNDLIENSCCVFVDRAEALRPLTRTM